MTTARWQRLGRVLRPATPHLIRSVRWPAIPLSWGVAGVFLGRTQFDPSVDAIVVSMIVAAGLSFIVADPAAVTLASSPTGGFDRLALRLVLTVPATVLAWVLLLRIGSSQPGMTLPDREAWLLLATFTMFSLAAELWAGGASTASGLVGVPALLAFQVIALQLPKRLALYPVAHHQWRWAIICLLSLTAVHSAVRDPARAARTFLPRRRRAALDEVR